MATRKPILSLDFDGVIHSYTSGWKGADVIPDPPVDGAIEFIRNAQWVFEVNIYSTRSNQPGGIGAMESAIERWAKDYGLSGRSLSDFMSKLKFPESKPPATVGIDDRVITFEGEWPDIGYLKKFKPWNKR